MVEAVLRQPLRLKLFVNEFGSDYREPSGFGYKDARLQVVSITSDVEGIKAAFAPVTFKFDGALGRIYGSFAVHEQTGITIWADPLAEAFKAVNNGDSLTVEPVLILEKETE